MGFTVNVVSELGSVFDGKSSEFLPVVIVDTDGPLAVSAVVACGVTHRLEASRACLISIESAYGRSLSCPRAGTGRTSTRTNM